MVAAALAEQVAAMGTVRSPGEGASRESFLAALDKVPDVEPVPEDRL